jgi:hypothetical protein
METITLLLSDNRYAVVESRHTRGTGYRVIESNNSSLQPDKGCAVYIEDLQPGEFALWIRIHKVVDGQPQLTRTPTRLPLRKCHITATR